MKASRILDIYTDGGCWPNPGPGGWAFVTRGGVKCYGSSCGKTTNNRMELTAVLMALEWAREHAPHVMISSDSQYAVMGCSTWLPGWRRKNWLRRDKGGSLVEVLNRDLWERIDAEIEEAVMRPSFRWVRGHSGNRMNEMADELATLGASCGQEYVLLDNRPAVKPAAVPRTEPSRVADPRPIAIGDIIRPVIVGLHGEPLRLATEGLETVVTAENLDFAKRVIADGKWIAAPLGDIVSPERS